MIDTHMPPPADLVEELHAHLARAGQALTADQMPEFLLTVPGPDGTIDGGCKGEIAFETGHISELWVSADRRGEGLGRRLLEAAEDLVRQKGCRRLHLETRNPSAEAIYARLGYTVFGRLSNYDGDNDFVYMVKELT
ncbi:MAG: GNAT family N-acetyltransferase [Pseudomonadota bacterium]